MAVLPQNPLKRAELLDTVNKLRGTKPWIQFELELLTTKYPRVRVLSKALQQQKAR